MDNYGKILAVTPVSYFECAPGGTKLRSDRDAVELIGEALGQGAGLVLVPVECLEDEFFQLRTGIAGAILQKFATYRMRLAIIGDISRYVEDSSALRDFVYESNRGDQVWFVKDRAELESRIK